MSVAQMSSSGVELQSIYALLRQLKFARLSEIETEFFQSDNLDIKSLYPRKFLLKLLNDRLVDLDKLANKLIPDLIKRLTRSPDQHLLVSMIDTNLVTKFIELDEYFHCCLYYLHDYILDFDWYESSIDDLTRADGAYVRSKLKLLDEFLAFRRYLIHSRVRPYKSIMTPMIGTSLKDGQPSLQKIRVETSIISRSIKSSLSSVRPDSNIRRRKVRFTDSPQTTEASRPHRIIAESQSILALNLVLFSLDLFSRKLAAQLIDWATKMESDLISYMELIRGSRQKLRSNQLISILRKIKRSNEVHLKALEVFYELKRIYLSEYLVNIVCARDSEHLLNNFKAPLVEVFLDKMGNGVERQMISNLAQRFLQISLDLIISEINLPPVELDSDSKSRSREQIAKSRENYLQFISEWFNVGDFFKTQSKEGNKISSINQNAVKASKLDPGASIKSSSRVLAQMDNLRELIRDLLETIAGRIQSKQQLNYFFNLIHDGLSQSFDIIAIQLKAQLLKVESKQPRTKIDLAQMTANIKVINDNIDLIGSKIRCLKLIHVVSAIQKLLNDMSEKSGVQVYEHGKTLDLRLRLFAESCSQQTDLI